MIGTVVKEFKVTGRLGKGGMGEVWVAEQQIVKTKVAIKLLLPEWSRESQIVQRFFNEAIAVSRIKHSGTVRIYDVGFHCGSAFLIMEFLEGETLSARIQRAAGRLPLEQAADIGRQLASVLGATHAAGITHRDLKPDNVFLVQDKELASGERAKILDFGIAKLGTQIQLTSAKEMMGTPGYMAPEQWTDAAHADASADVYSLGCIAFEMCCGRPPFIISNMNEAFAKHVHEVPPRALSFVPGLPYRLDEIIAAALAKKPADRPSMKSLHQAFATILSEPILHRPESSGGHAERHPPSPPSVQTHRSLVANVASSLPVAEGSVATQSNEPPLFAAMEPTAAFTHAPAHRHSNGPTRLAAASEPPKPRLPTIIDVANLVTHREGVALESDTTHHKVGAQARPPQGPRATPDILKSGKLWIGIVIAMIIAGAVMGSFVVVHDQEADAEKRTTADRATAEERAKAKKSAAQDAARVAYRQAIADGTDANMTGDDVAALYQAACDAEEMSACITLGLLYEGGTGVAIDKAKAAALLKKACDHFDLEGCRELDVLRASGVDKAKAGMDYEHGVGVPRDQAQDAALYRKACDSGDMEGCTHLGSAYYNGVGVESSYAKAAALYTKACDGDDMEGCTNLGLLYSKGVVLERDYVKAAALYTKACDGGNIEGCYRLGLAYDNGVGVVRDNMKAATLYNKACDGGDIVSCRNLGIDYEEGTGVAIDKAKAAALYRKACDGGDMEGCHQLGIDYEQGAGVAIDKVRAMLLYRKACSGGILDACAWAK